jgi:hypothetical protein
MFSRRSLTETGRSLEHEPDVALVTRQPRDLPASTKISRRPDPRVRRVRRAVVLPQPEGPSRVKNSLGDLQVQVWNCCEGVEHDLHVVKADHGCISGSGRQRNSGQQRSPTDVFQLDFSDPGARFSVRSPVNILVVELFVELTTSGFASASAFSFTGGNRIPGPLALHLGGRRTNRRTLGFRLLFGPLHNADLLNGVGNSVLGTTTPAVTPYASSRREWRTTASGRIRLPGSETRI